MEYGGAWESDCFAHERTLEGMLAFPYYAFGTLGANIPEIEIGVCAAFVRFVPNDCAYLDGYCVLVMSQQSMQVPANIFSNRLARKFSRISSRLFSRAWLAQFLFPQSARYGWALCCMFGSGPHVFSLIILSRYLI